MTQLTPLSTPTEQSSTAEELAALPELYGACEHVLGNRGRPPGEKVRGGVPGGIHLHQGALDARSRVLTVLASWSGLVVGERGGPGPRLREVDALVRYLLANLDWLLAHAAAADFEAEVREVARAARRVGGTEEHRREVGACATCGSRVWAGRSAVRCERGHDLPVREWLLLGGAA